MRWFAIVKNFFSFYMSIQRDLKPSCDPKTSVWQNKANNQQNNFLTVTMSDKFWKKKG